MTQWGYEDNDDAGQDNTTELEGPKALRDAYNKLKQQSEETNNLVRQLLEDKKKSQLADVFQSLGVPGAKDVYQGDADPEKAKAWVESMRGVFGTGNPGETPSVVDSAPALAPDAQAQYQRMTEAGQSGVPMGNMDAAYAAVGDATDINGLIAGFQNALRTNGA
jgi:hypothetical protein